MKHLTKSSIIGAVAAALTACASAGAAVVSTSPDQGHVLFDGGEFVATTPQRVTFVDIWQEEEYTRFEGNGTRAEIIYAVADERDSVVLDYKLTLPQTIKSWSANASGALSWGEKGTIRAPIGEFQYQIYTQGSGNRSCVGFSSEWDYRAGDPELRPAKALFGYYCDKPGASLNKDKVAGVLSDLWIKGIRRTDFRFTPRLSLASSSGTGGTTTGNTGFPYVMADRFVDADGERSGD
ncbi:MAG: hypothetical protein GKS00_23185 [Alphaproteobacteria bacterium]|nr:hypothetical protein [Alphaproteobacteria bacterium]